MSGFGMLEWRSRLSRMACRIRAAGLIAISAFGLANPAGGAAAQTRTSTQFWPEIQIHVALDPRTKLIFLGNIARDRELSRNLEGQVGIHIDHKLTDIFSVRAGYRFGGSLVEGDPFTEHRLLLEQTFQFPLPQKFVASFRTREDFRLLNGDLSVRLRERVTIERTITFDNFSITPYGSAEIYFDTRYDRFSRHRFMAGAVVPVFKSLSIDVYWSRQSDTRPERKHVNAIGVSLIFNY